MTEDLDEEEFGDVAEASTKPSTLKRVKTEKAVKVCGSDLLHHSIRPTIIKWPCR